jgi:hypothetical protein
METNDSFFFIKNFDLIFNNYINYLNVVSTFKPMEKDLIKLVHQANNVNDINLLENDIEHSKKHLEQIKIKTPRLSDAVDKHIKWIDEVLSEEVKNQKRSVYRKHGRVLTETYLDILVEQKTTNENIFPIFILLTKTNRLLSSIITKITDTPYAHASISFDSSLENMCSFGQKEFTNLGKFIDNESYKDGLLGKRADNTTYSLYVTFMTQDGITRMKQKLEYIKSQNMMFSIRGLINIALNKESDYKNRYFCSQFIADILQTGTDEKILNRHPSLYTPYDLRLIPNMYFVTRGILSNYNRKKTDMVVDNMLKNR